MDSNQLVPQGNDPFALMERIDEQQVLDEIKGRAIEALVYEIRQGGQTITGLSLCGVREVARMMNVNGRARIGISDREPIITENDEYFEVKVFAADTQNGGGYWGIKRQPKKYTNGSINQFALEQALAKAQRNALRGLIPEYFAREMIDAFRTSGKAKSFDHRTTPQQNAPHGRDWEASTDLVDRITNEIAYFAGNRSRVLSALRKLESEGPGFATLDDNAIFERVNERAKRKADEHVYTTGK